MTHPLLSLVLLFPSALLFWAVGVTGAGWVALLADRGKPAKMGRKEVGIASREAAARLLLAVCAPLGWGEGRPREGTADATGTPVLLVSGWPQNRFAMQFLAIFLRSRGAPWVWAVGSGRGVLAERAEWLAARVERLCDESGAEQIDVVAHGLGGLVAAWYVRHSSGPLRVRRLVTLGTPWGGTRMAVFTSGALGRETMVGSSVLDDLSPCRASAVCIWGSHDPMVLPASSAVADEAVAVYLSGAGHLDLLLSSRAFRAVRQALLQPEVGTDT